MAENTSRRLAAPVYVNDRWYTPSDDVPDDVAARITNPKAWAVDSGSAENTEQDNAPRAGARLASRVNVGGTWYGPADEVPLDVAVRITNPKAWEGGRVPDEVAAAAKRAAGTSSGTSETSGAGTGDTGGDGGGATPTPDTSGAQDSGSDPATRAAAGTGDGNDGTANAGGDTPPAPAKAARTGRGGGRAS